MNADIPDTLPLSQHAQEHDLRIRVAAFPSDAHSWFLLGRILRMSEKYEDSEKALRRSIMIDPKQVHVWLELAAVLDKLGFHADAQAIRQNVGEDGSLLANLESLREMNRFAICMNCDKHTYYGCTHAGECDKLRK